MDDELQLFRGRDYKVNDKITIHHPTIDEICSHGEQRYYSMLSSLCATPSEYKVQLLDGFGIDYEEITEFYLFCIMIRMFSQADTFLILGELDLQQFDIVENTETQELLLYDRVNDITIDRAIHALITDRLRLLHGFEKKVEVPGNEDTKRYLLDKERRRLKYESRQKHGSMLVPLISAMVNCEQFKYNHETVWSLPIYVFMDSVRRIQKLKNYNQVMQGVYAGTIDLKSLDSEGLNWMGSLSES